MKEKKPIQNCLSFIPKWSNHCTLQNVLNETVEIEDIFNVTWREPQHELEQPLDENSTLIKSESQSLMMLTRSPFSYSCLKGRLRDEKCCVNFALRYILKQKFYSVKETVSYGELLLRQSTSTTITILCYSLPFGCLIFDSLFISFKIKSEDIN